MSTEESITIAPDCRYRHNLTRPLLRFGENYADRVRKISPSEVHFRDRYGTIRHANTNSVNRLTKVTNLVVSPSKPVFD